MMHDNFGCPQALIIYLLQREDLRLCEQNHLVAFFMQIPKIPGCWPISSRAAFGGHFSGGFWFLPILFLLKCRFQGKIPSFYAFSFTYLFVDEELNLNSFFCFEAFKLMVSEKVVVGISLRRPHPSLQSCT